MMWPERSSVCKSKEKGGQELDQTSTNCKEVSGTVSPLTSPPGARDDEVCLSKAGWMRVALGDADQPEES